MGMQKEQHPSEYSRFKKKLTLSQWKNIFALKKYSQQILY